MKTTINGEQRRLNENESENNPRKADNDSSFG